MSTLRSEIPNPRPETGNQNSEIESTFPASDGVPLFYRSWLPRCPSEKAIILLHRGHEHSARLANLVRDLELPDVTMFAWDARGHGRSPGDRGYAESLSVVIRDLHCFVQHIHATHRIPVENMILLAHSVGAVVAAAYVHDYAPPVRAMILATPALRVKLYVPFAIPGLRFQLKFRPRANVKSYVKAKMLTHDPAQAAAYDNDPLISRNIAVNILLDLHDTATRLLDDAPAIHTPTLILTAGSDWVVKNSAAKTFFDRLSSPAKQIEHYPGFHHAIYHESDRGKPIARTRRFILDAFSAAVDESADPVRASKAEFDYLSKPLSFFSPKRWSFALQKRFLQSVGRLSEGIRIGWSFGFDSGQSLDYVYRNTPRGFTPLGRLIDRIYLGAIGWRGIRLRKKNLETLLARMIRSAANTQSPVCIVDIASGPGRYLLDTLKSIPDVPIHALLRDRSSTALDEGRSLARAMNLTDITFTGGDAFDAASLASIAPKPHIAIVSGLYELFPDNTLVLNSLRGLHSALLPGGFLIYTNQPWHPQVEMIARVLINRDQKPWVMRRRSQFEMDQLVQASGFEKQDMLLDPWGIFTVSIARRI